MAGLLGAMPCVVARCCVRVVCVIQTLALVVGLLIALSIDAINQLPIASVCELQDDFAGLTCIGYREHKILALRGQWGHRRPWGQIY